MAAAASSKQASSVFCRGVGSPRDHEIDVLIDGRRGGTKRRRPLAELQPFVALCKASEKVGLLATRLQAHARGPFVGFRSVQAAASHAVEEFSVGHLAKNAPSARCSQKEWETGSLWEYGCVEA